MVSRRLQLGVLGLAAALIFLPAPLMLGHRLFVRFSSTPLEDFGPSVSLMGKQLKIGDLVKRMLFTENQNTGKAPVERLPAPTVGTWMNGSWQQTFERWFEPRLAGREPLVRTANQLYYSLFSKSYMYNGYVIIGGQKEFYELCYIEDACNFPKAPGTVEDAVGVRRLAEVGKRWQARGKAFAVMLVPHKAEMVPQQIPSRYCPSPGRSQRRLQLLTALRQAGLTVIDPEQDILKLAESTGLPAYPRGGTHWSELGAYAAAQSLTAEISRQLNQPLMAERVARFDLHGRPFGSDADLVALANLAFPPLDYQAPRLAFPESDKRPLNSRRLVIVGDSFTYTLAEVLEQQRVFARMTHYFYYSLGRYEYPGRTRYDVDRKTVNWDDEFLAADALVFVGNAVTFMAPQNIEFFDDALAHTGGNGVAAKL
jgi:alginate O-acetyltransferase complex protein AlgJ